MIRAHSGTCFKVGLMLHWLLFPWMLIRTLLMQGQCGLGTPLETLAAQRRAEWDMGPVATPSHASQTSMGMRGTNEGWAAEGGGAESGAQSSGWAWPQQQQQQEQQSQLQQHANRMAPYLQPYAEHTARQAELEHTRRCPPPPLFPSSDLPQVQVVPCVTAWPLTCSPTWSILPARLSSCTHSAHPPPPPQYRRFSIASRALCDCTAPSIFCSASRSNLQLLMQPYVEHTAQ